MNMKKMQKISNARGKSWKIYMYGENSLPLPRTFDIFKESNIEISDDLRGLWRSELGTVSSDPDLQYFVKCLLKICFEKLQFNKVNSHSQSPHIKLHTVSCNKLETTIRCIN